MKRPSLTRSTNRYITTSIVPISVGGLIVSGKLVKVILNFFKLWNQCHQKIYCSSWHYLLNLLFKATLFIEILFIVTLFTESTGTWHHSLKVWALDNIQWKYGHLVLFTNKHVFPYMKTISLCKHLGARITFLESIENEYVCINLVLM